MNRRSRRKVLVLALVFGVSIAAVLGLTALEENMLFFFSPTQVNAGEAPLDRSFRVGGLVVPGSISRLPDSLTVRFEVTDEAENMFIEYTGILPDLFSEGEGIVAIGNFAAGGRFVASEVLAKHDENYMPPEVADALKASGKYDYLEKM